MEVLAEELAEVLVEAEEDPLVVIAEAEEVRSVVIAEAVEDLSAATVEVVVVRLEVVSSKLELCLYFVYNCILVNKQMIGELKE